MSRQYRPPAKPEQFEELVEHLDEMTVEVDQPDAKVRIFFEQAWSSFGWGRSI